jgi:hypothetical protein
MPKPDIVKSDVCGFNWEKFPIGFHGHKLFIVNNDCYVNEDDRLRFHLILYCKSCEKESGVRGRLMSKNTEHQKNAARLKLYCFYKFLTRCSCANSAPSPVSNASGLQSPKGL